MAIGEVQAKGLEYLALATELLQRARLADAEAGSYATVAARSLYVGAGFRVTSTSTSYSWKRQ